jgi:uncharacterized protein YjbI with pentapeptide repeats
MVPTRNRNEGAAMRTSLSLLIAASLVLPCAAPAYDPAALEHFGLFRECKGCDLSGVDLSYETLKNVDLTGANLSNATLKAADFYSAILVDVDLRGADLTEANLNSAVLRGADLRGATLYNTKLLGTNLTDADLGGAIKLGEIAVSEAVLCRTRLDGGVEERDCK